MCMLCFLLFAFTFNMESHYINSTVVLASCTRLHYKYTLDKNLHIYLM